MSKPTDSPQQPTPPAWQDAKLSSLYAESRQGDEPSAAVDDAILAQARRALQQPPAALHAGSRPARWALPTAVAATLVISASLYLVNDPTSTEPLLEGRTPLSQPAPKALLETSAERADNAPPASEKRQRAEADRGPSETAAPASPSRQKTEAAEREAPPQATRSKQHLPSRDLGAAQKAAPLSEHTAEPSSGAAIDRQPLQDQLTTATAEQWLARIQALMAQGEISSARAALQRFQQAYPDYPLPAEVLPLSNE